MQDSNSSRLPVLGSQETELPLVAEDSRQEQVEARAYLEGRPWQVQLGTFRDRRDRAFREMANAPTEAQTNFHRGVISVLDWLIDGQAESAMLSAVGILPEDEPVRGDPMRPRRVG